MEIPMGALVVEARGTCMALCSTGIVASIKLAFFWYIIYYPFRSHHPVSPSPFLVVHFQIFIRSIPSLTLTSEICFQQAKAR